MAISFIGSATGLVGSAATTVNFSSLLNAAGAAPTLAANDIVIICQSRRSAGATANVAPTGYSTLTLSGAVTNLFADATDDTNVSIFYKVMGATPDTSVTLNSPGTTQVSSYTIHVLRGVDTTTPFDGVTPTTVTKTTTGAPDPAAITPATAGAWIMVFAACGSANAAGSNTVFTAPSNIDTTTNTFRASTGTRTGTAGGLFSGWASGAFDPNAFGGGIVTSGGSSAAITLAVRPASTGATAQELDPPLLTNSTSLFAPQLNLTLTGALLTNANSLFGPQLNLTLSPPLLSNSAALYAPTVSNAGIPAQTLNAPLLTDADSLFAPRLNLNLAAPLLTNANSFFGAKVNLNVQPPLLTDPDTLFPPSLGSALAVPLLVNTAQLFGPTVNQTIRAPLLSDPDVLFGPTVSTGAQTLQMPLLGGTAPSSNVTVYWLA